ncbi:hypothetical protein [Campylobacter showae]|nr:hypothetical protein [Campylobacter showae]
MEKTSNINFQNKDILFNISFAKSLNLNSSANACAAVKTQAKAAF